VLISRKKIVCVSLCVWSVVIKLGRETGLLDPLGGGCGSRGFLFLPRNKFGSDSVSALGKSDLGFAALVAFLWIFCFLLLWFFSNFEVS